MPSLLYIASEDWFFENHFAHLAEAAQQGGHDVAIACRVDAESPLFRHRFALYPQKFERGKRSLVHALCAAPRLIATMRQAQPRLIHIIGLQNILFVAPLACLFTRARILLAPIGLGQFWVEDSFRAKLARCFVKTYLRFFKSRRCFYIFENNEDAAELSLQNYSRLKIVGGAGVDEAQFSPQPFPPGPPLRVAVVSRMLKAKGIAESAEAVQRAREKGHDITLDLWGAPDAANTSSLSKEELRALSQNGVSWRGETDDVQGVWRNSHVALLLSKREGLPKALLEAAACGRPIITSDAPGCRALVRDNQEGLLIDLEDKNATVTALIKLSQDEALRERLGANARARVLQGFTQKRVAADILEFYAAALA